MYLFVLNEVGLSKSDISDFLSLVHFNSMDLFFLQSVQAHISMFEREIVEHVIGSSLSESDSRTNKRFDIDEIDSIVSVLFRELFIGSFDISHVSDVVKSLIRLKVIGLSLPRIYAMYSHYVEFVSSHIFLLKKNDVDGYHGAVSSFHKAVTINLYFASKVYGAN